MNNITITIAAPELVAALNNLATALQNSGTNAGQSPSVATPQPLQPATQQLVPTVAPTTPTTPPATVPQPAPTTVPEYTQEQLARAATPIVDAGKAEELRNLLAQFGVMAITELTKEQYGSFATALRGMGAQI